MNWQLHGFVMAVLFLLTACGQSPAAVQQVFVTEYGLGPDKWATAWLLTRRVAPGAKLIVVETGKALPTGVAFDMLDSDVRRQGNKSAFEIARDLHKITDPDVQHLAQIVHDIEVNFWGREEAVESPLVEHAFRSLQRRPGQGEVAPECYIAFFDSVYNAVQTQRDTGKEMTLGDLAVDCPTAVAVSAGDSLVPEMPIPELLAEIRRGKSVIFVDVRESNEFAESHIPGARNITLRDLSPETVKQVQHADYVVSYCVKDFRGFEMAKALRNAGVRNSVILSPYGIKGWVSQGLPTVGTKGLGEVAGAMKLARCAASRASCSPTTASH